jgi:hypothetical protein
VLLRIINLLITLILFIPLFIWYTFLSLIIWNKKYVAQVCGAAAYILAPNEDYIQVDWLPPPPDVEENKK